jgi:peptidoglycan hydrolase-like protein with peptidoglycan-binding domain
MLFSRASLAFFLSAAVAAAPVFAATTTTTHKKITHARTTHLSSARSTSAHVSRTSLKSRKGAGSRHARLRGQQTIDSSRATEIQQALIREHYLNGEPSGQWDSATVTAMQKFQADQGWQTKLMPDSRALKKLGLGPDYSNAINANGSSFADPKNGQIPAAQAAGFAAASGVNR